MAEKKDSKAKGEPEVLAIEAPKDNKSKEPPPMSEALKQELAALTNTQRAAVLMLLLDAGVGVGGWGGEARGQTPQLEALLEQLPLGLAMTDRDGRFLFANKAFLRAAGHDDPHAPPPYPSDLVIREDKGALADAVRRFAQGAGGAGDVAVRLRSAARF